MKMSPRLVASDRDENLRIRKHRRQGLRAGLGAIVVTSAALVALGSGCIFDESDYRGGGRRSTVPTSTDTTSTPDPTESSSPPASTAPEDSGPQVPDGGARDA